MHAYMNRVMELMKYFKKVTMVQILRSENAKADALVKLG